MSLQLRFGLFGVVCAALGLAPTPARADSCVRFTFRPDCYRASGDAGCVQTIDRLDLGPQIAVWIEDAAGTLVDTAMVTALTATRGIGNRPGLWNFLSGPKFPYGKRYMALPIWAYARGTSYPAVVMQDGREDWLGWHEPHSSEENFFCRPLMPREINVDAITCPTRFNSAKGRFDATATSYYPPRNDLTAFTSLDCDMVGQSIDTCTMAAQSYAVMNDLDAVAAATPAYGADYSGLWYIPPDLASGDYAVMVEVNKEFDNNPAHSHPSFEDPRLVGYGIGNNFGQPSVVYRVPIHIDGNTQAAASTSQIFGYSRWADDGAFDGTILPPDATISTADPGSGEGRLLLIPGSTGMGRVHVGIEQCATCDPVPPPPTEAGGLAVVESTLTATTAEIQFTNAAAASGVPVQSYDIRYRVGTEMTDTEFAQATPAPLAQPGAPGTAPSVVIQDLKPATSYVLGIRAVDTCRQRSPIAVLSFSTTVMKFTQLSGCFVATAAYGSELEPGVAALRAARDRLRPASALFAAATDLYYRSGPAAADVLRRSDTARAVVRRLLGPVAALAEAAVPAGAHPIRPLTSDQPPL